MSSSAITTQVVQLKAGSIQNQADSSSIYSSGQWSFKNSTAVASVTITDAGNVSVPGTTQISWPVDGGTSRGLVTIGAQGTTGGSLFVNTPSLSVGYASGLAVDGSYSSFISTVNIKALGVSSAGGYGSVLAFHTSSGTSSAERMRIDASGNVGIGITPIEKLHVNNGVVEVQRSIGTGNATYFRLHHAGNVYVHHNISGNTNYDIVNSTNGVRLSLNSTSWGAISDERKKKNIKPLEYGLAQISALKPVRFDYKTEESDGSERIGFIAQELLPVIKEAVQGSEDTEYSVTPTDLIPVLVKAIQEQQAQIEEMKTKLAALEAKP